jgi:hypothetical protein
MALDSHVFTPGNPPDHSSALTQIALNRPDVFKAFSQGYDEAQKRQLALQQYREAKVKADLAEQMYPGLLRYQQAQLAQKMNYLNNPTTYGAPNNAIAPISTGGGTTTPAGSAPGTAPAGIPRPVTPDVRLNDPAAGVGGFDTTNPFNTPSAGLPNTQVPGITIPSEPVHPGDASVSFNPFDGTPV